MDGMVKAGCAVAVVPARGGSKSIPRKNVKLLGGVPLLAYSIEAGLAAVSVDRVIVSTDDDEVATIARKFGADVPFMRPAWLAQDATQDLPVFQHALGWLEGHDGYVPEILVQLRPTSPLRPPGCVDAAIELLRADRTADCVRGVVESSQNPFKMWRLQPDGALLPLLDGVGPEPYNRPRQELPTTYWQTGHIDAIRTSTIREKNSLSGDRIRALILDSAYACDIDTEADWKRTEWTLAGFDRPIIRPRGRRELPDDIRLVVFDFDGVLTDNRVWVADDGEEWVACNRSDGLGLERLRRLGIELFVMSAERNPVVGGRCGKLGLRYEQSVPNKASRLRELLIDWGIKAAQVVYVGNDINDLDCMRTVGCGVAVADAHREVLLEADVVLERSGGDGAVRELCDRVAAHLSTRTR
jgi:N-acylneuraminate cytidylyltransferase